MKKEYLTFLAFTFMILISYGCKNGASTSIQEQKFQPTVAMIAGRDVVVWFADSVAQSRAKQFIQNLTLTIIDSSRYDLRSPHELDLQVPLGQEMKWSDSLKTFPIVVASSPVYILPQ
jgi:hypothetical protein